MMTEQQRKKIFTPDALRDALRGIRAEDVAVILQCYDVLSGDDFRAVCREIVLSAYKR